MELTQKITLELQKSAVYQCVWAKQGDDDSRKLVVQFTDAGVPYTVPTGATVVLRVRRPDGIFITSKPGTHNTDGTVSITMDGTMLAVPGTASADTCIMQGEQVLSSFNFEIRVQSFPAGTIDPGDATGENWLELIREATAGVKSVNGVKPDGNGNVEIETGGGGATPEAIAEAVEAYLTEHPVEESDPTVPQWAKEPEKPTYTAEEVGALTANSLQAATDAALAQAKESGEFDGTDGVTPTIGDNGNWFLGEADTGKPSCGPKGDDYILTEADKQEILDSLEAAIAGVPGYWKAALDTGVQAINTALCTAGANKSAFLFYSDAHWDYGSQMSPTLLKYLYQHTGITKTFFGGDIVNDEGTDYDTMEYLWDWRHQLKDLLNHHSVVGNHDDGNSTNNLFSEAYIYGYLLAPEETPDIVREEKGLWYYMDSPAEKTRYLFLDTAYKGATDAQLDFVKAALLDTPEKWHIVGIAHIWYDPDYDQYDQRPVPIKGLNADASKIITLLDAYNSRTGDYASCGGWVEFCIGGHCHYDYDGTTTTGIPIALVETDSKHLRDTQTFTAGTTTESSVNGIVADYTNRSLHIIRVGRGKSRDVTLPASSAMMTYTNVLGTVGYVENKRLSPSSGYIEKDGDTDLTGFIPVNAGDIIFMKNVVMPSTDTTGYANMAYLFDSSKAGINCIHLTVSQADMGVVADASGNVVQFTVIQKHLTETSGYLRIGATDINAASIITVNEPIG